MLNPLAALIIRIADTPLAMRGVAVDRVVLDSPVEGTPRGDALVLLGLKDLAAFEQFQDSREANDGHPHPLDRWSDRWVTAIATEFGAEPVSPNDRRVPFQRLGMQAEGLTPSPIGLLMHPSKGLWHAYRGALRFPVHHPLYLALAALQAPPTPKQSLCEQCPKPCLSGCPVSAFSENGFDVARCAQHLKSDAGRYCLIHGCQARDACPHGRPFRYSQAQRQFHIKAFARSLGIVP